VAGYAADRFWVECGANVEIDQSTTRPAEAELLPARIAAACACALDADGAGLSVLDGGFRVPLGASDDTASYAERLQFTQGQGPCLEAALGGRPVVAGAADLRQRWPQFADVLFASTPYRAVLTVPLSIMSATRGALDLFLTDEADLTSVLLADAAEVSAAVVQALRTADEGEQRPAWPEDEGDRLPSWLAGPTANRRRFVWLAVGLVMATLDVSADDALSLLRAYAYGHNQLLDDVASALVDGRLRLNEIRTGDGGPSTAG
jgi:hypothetical protein